MSQSTFSVGDRVSLIPFKHKGKTATVKYFGPIGKKFGVMVGLELDEPTGENSGEVNGEQVFECKENHGLILRNTQVRLLNAPPPSIKPKVAALDENLIQQEENKMSLGDSPLITPKEAPNSQTQGTSSASTLMQKMNEAMSQQKPSAGSEPTVDNKPKGWQERLEKMKQRRAEERQKKQEEEQKKFEELLNEDDIRKSFAPQSGIQRSTDDSGKQTLQIKQNEVVARPKDPEQLLKEAALKEAQQKETQKSSSSALAAVSRLSNTLNTKSDSESGVKATGGAPSLTSRLGQGIGSRLTQTTAQKQQDIKAKQEEIAQKRTLRQSNVTPRLTNSTATGRTATATATTGASTAVGTSGVTRPTASTTAGSASARTSSRLRGPTATSTIGRTTISSRQATEGAKPEETEPTRKSYLTRKPAPTTQSRLNTGAVSARGTSRTASNTRGSTLNTSSPKRTTASRLGTTTSSNSTTGVTPQRNLTKSTSQAGLGSVSGGVGVGAQSRLNTGRDRTPGSGRVSVGPSSAANSAELKRLEASVREKETDIANLRQKVKVLESEKIAQLKEQDEAVAKVTREKELLKKQLEAKVNSLQTQVQSHKEQLADAEQTEQAALEKSRLDEEYAVKIAELEFQLEETQKKVTDGESALQAMKVQLEEAEGRHAEELLKMEEKHAEALLKAEEAAQDAVRESAEDSSQASKEQVQQIEKELSAKFEQTQKAFEGTIAQKQAEIKAKDEKVTALEAKLKEEEERRKEEAEIAELEKDAIRDEKQELMDKLMEQSKVDEEDPLKDLSLEEVKQQNKKLRQAIVSLTFGFEQEKQRLEEQMQQETGKDKIIAEQEARLTEMDFLLEEVERKESERADMEEKLEEIVEYENMVDEMVTEIAEKEEENDLLTERIGELEEENGLLDELNTQLENYNKEMSDEMAEKESKITEAKTEIDQLESIVIEQDGIGSKYKDRMQELQKQIKTLGEQLADSVKTEDKDHISVLLEKQQVLISRLREQEKKILQITKAQIYMQQEKLGVSVIQNMLPDSLMEEALLPNLKKIQSLNFVKHKAMLLVREICETQIETAPSLYSEADQLQEFYQTLMRICNLSKRLVASGNRTCFFVANMSPPMYAEIMKLLAWDHLGPVCDQIDTILDTLKEENMASNHDTSQFESLVSQVDGLMSTVEKAFTGFCPSEIKRRDEAGGKMSEEDLAEQQKRQNLAQNCEKLQFRDQIVSIAIGAIFVPRMQTEFESELDHRQTIQKVSLIYWRLLDIVLKLDNISNVDSGAQYLDLEKLNTQARLAQKYDSLKLLWEGSAQERKDAQKQNLVSVLEAIERDITQLTNDFKFKQLAESVEAKYGTGKVDLNDLYAVDQKANGPWRVISNQVKAELKDMGALKQRNSYLVEKQKEQLKQMAVLKKEKDEAAFISQTQAGRLSQALAKAEQIPALEIEKKDLQARINELQRQLDLAGKDLNLGRTSIDDLKKKLEEAKKKGEDQAQFMGQDTGNTSGAAGVNGLTMDKGRSIKARPLVGKNQTRQSVASNFFIKLQQGGLPGGKGAAHDTSANGMNRQGASMLNNAQMIQQMQMSEDAFANTINELQADRMRLKGKDMLKRLLTLDNQEGAFAQLAGEYEEQGRLQFGGASQDGNTGLNMGGKDRGCVSIQLNEVEKNKLEGALTSVETLKFKVKKQMASRRIVNLTIPHTQSTIETTPSDADHFEEAISVDRKLQNQKSNYLLLDAREKIRDALDILFAKDSNLRNTVPTISSSVSKNGNYSSQRGLTDIKLGSVRLKSKVRLPSNRVVFDQESLMELKRNVTLLASN